MLTCNLGKKKKKPISLFEPHPHNVYCHTFIIRVIGVDLDCDVAPYVYLPSWSLFHAHFRHRADDRGCRMHFAQLSLAHSSPAPLVPFGFIVVHILTPYHIIQFTHPLTNAAINIHYVLVFRLIVPCNHAFPLCCCCLHAELWIAVTLVGDAGRDYERGYSVLLDHNRLSH